MKTVLKITTLLSLSIILAVSSAHAQEPKVLDGAWIKENTPTRRVVPYTHVREADVMWHRRIWREIDLREKINLPLYYPIQPIAGRKSLYEVIKMGIMEGTITAYSDEDDEFTVPLTIEEAKSKMGGWEKIPLFDEYGDQYGMDSTFTELTSQDIVKYRLKEDWFFDRERSVMDVRIIGIAPVKQVLNDDGTVRGVVALYWVYFPQARYIFANYDVFNRHNDAERRTFEDVFWKRMFSSYIQKRSNVYNRFLTEHKQGMDVLLEGEKIKDEITNYEHDLWHF